MGACIAVILGKYWGYVGVILTRDWGFVCKKGDDSDSCPFERL